MREMKRWTEVKSSFPNAKSIRINYKCNRIQLKSIQIDFASNIIIEWKRWLSEYNCGYLFVDKGTSIQLIQLIISNLE